MHYLPSSLVVAEHRAIPASGIDIVRIRRIGSNVSKLESSGRRPIAIRDLAIIAAARDRGRSAILLRCVDVIGKLLVGADVIKLAGCLVIPGTPGIAAVDTDDRALVNTEDHVLSVGRVDPESVKIIATGRSRPGFEAAASVLGSIHGSLRHVNQVRIPGINEDAAEVSPPHNARIGRAGLPASAAVV